MQTVLSEVLVRNKRLLLTLKDKGSVYFDWKHQFSSRSLDGAEECQNLAKVFSRYSPKVFDRIAKFKFMQITGPVDLADRLDGKRKKIFEDNFETGKYIDVARWNFGIPFWHAHADDNLIELLETKKVFDAELNEDYAEKPAERKSRREEFRKGLENLVKKHFNGRVEINKKDKVYDIILEDTNCIMPSHSLSASEIQNGKVYVFDIEKPLFRKEKSEVSWLAYTILDHGKIIKKGIKTLRKTGVKTIDDYEIEEFDSELELVDSVRKEITTPDRYRDTIDSIVAYNAPYDIENTREAGKAKIKGRKVNKFAVGERETDPKVEVAMNFFRKLRVQGRLIIDPLRAARIRYKHLPNRKFELVLAEAQGIKHAKDLNYDQLEELELTAIDGNIKHLSRGALELVSAEAGKSVTDDPELKEYCARVIAHYVGKDVTYLQQMFQDKWFADYLADMTWLSNIYKVELSRLIHSPNGINKAQERSYFQFTGAHRDRIYREFNRNTQLNQIARENVKEYIETQLCLQSVQGLHKDVYKVYLPLGNWLATHVEGYNQRNKQSRFPEVNRLVSYAEERRNDKARFFTLSQYLESLAEFLIVKFGKCRQAREEYSKLLAHHNLDEKEFGSFSEVYDFQQSPFRTKLDAHKIPEVEFNRFFINYKRILHADSKPLPNMQVSGAEFNLLKGKLKPDTIGRYPDAAFEFCNTHNLTTEQLAELFALKAVPQKKKPTKTSIDTPETRWYAKHHHVSQDALKDIKEAKDSYDHHARSFAGQFNTDFETVGRTLDQQVGELQDFFERSGFRVIHAQAGFAYVTGGNPKALNHPTSPVIPVDTIPRAFISINPAETKKRDRDDLEHKIYYRKHNYYEGIKITDRSTHSLTLFEMQTYIPIIEHIIDGEYKDALEYAQDSLQQLRDIVEEKTSEVENLRRTLPAHCVDQDLYQHLLTIPKEDLLWFSKARNRYRGWQYGELIQFVTDKAHVPEGAELQTENGSTFFEEPARKNSEQLRKVYVMPISDFQPDVQKFYERVKSRVADLIRPLIGLHESFEFVNKPQTDVESFLRN